MNIALIGYGKMGHIIESVALARGHRIVCRLDGDWQLSDLSEADIAIEFTVPSAAASNIRRAVQAGLPVVSGTTGWDVQALRDEMPDATIIWSSNFSIGVNILFAVNQYLARLMQRIGGYTPSILEVHHIHKLDQPSGTAKSLAEQIDGDVPIQSVREGEVPGIHEISWQSDADILSLRHEAKSRQGFALGAVLAAEWLISHHGWHTMTEVMEQL